MNTPEVPSPPVLDIQGTEMIRMVGNRLMRVTVVPPEDPAAVMERDKVPQDYVGRRWMTPLSSYGNTPGASCARQAPTYTGETPGFFHN